ncbi:MAG: cytochrome c oxidase subunit 3 [Nocardioides sp.]|uniref:cytochrome c oxidase subunit 3 n=1 Tax=Nocardioides sp. TaxID=35761 RepID=UPI0039E53980
MSAPESTPAVPRRMPGIDGFWVFIGGDLGIFTLLFFAFLSARAGDVAGFDHARQELEIDRGAINTFVLLTSSWCVAQGLERARRNRPEATRWVAGALALGVLFIAGKAWEYALAFRHDHLPSESDFFTYYFVLTGIHLAHVTVGCVLMAVTCLLWRRRGPRATRGAESIACYWHLVDFLWIVIFPLIYLLR